MPTRFAARKWPSSCTKTSTPRTNANARIVVKPTSSDLQFYSASDLLRTSAGPSVHGPHRGEGRHLSRLMRVHGALDDLGNRHEPDPSLEKEGNRDLVGRVQHDRPAISHLE